MHRWAGKHYTDYERRFKLYLVAIINGQPAVRCRTIIYSDTYSDYSLYRYGYFR